MDSFLRFISLLFICISFYMILEQKRKIKILDRNIKEKDKEILELYSIVSDIMDKLEEYLPAPKHPFEVEKQASIDPIHEERNDPALSIKNDKEEDMLSEVFNVKKEKIEEFLAQGLSVPEIARTLNMGKGELQLLLEIDKRKM